jgi:hypothetical protein
MSNPSFLITCTGCNYSSRYAYRVHYAVQNMDVRPEGIFTDGWCNRCNEVLCIFSASNSLRMTRSLLNESTAELDKRAGGIIGSLMSKVSSERQRELAYRASEIQRLQKWEAIMGDSPPPDRCLTCGSTDVRVVQLPTEYLSPIPIGVTHTCSGVIMANMDLRIRFGDLPKVVCDVRGNIVTDER